MTRSDRKQIVFGVKQFSGRSLISSSFYLTYVKFDRFKMSGSGSDTRSISDNGSFVQSEESEEDYGVVNLGEGGIMPYQDEPLLPQGMDGEDVGNHDNDEDIDGIPLASLEARFEKRVPVNGWYVLFANS